MKSCAEDSAHKKNPPPKLLTGKRKEADHSKFLKAMYTKSEVLKVQATARVVPGGLSVAPVGKEGRDPGVGIMGGTASLPSWSPFGRCGTKELAALSTSIGRKTLAEGKTSVLAFSCALP